TMGAVREARQKGATVLAISNVLDSSIPRASDHAFYTHAGPEIGVASTKAFTTQLVAMTLFAIYLGRRTGTLSRERARELLAELTQLPNKMRDVVESGAHLQVLARRYGHAIGFLFLGRGPQYPIALEGALKLKEISYIHAEGYAAGEMKHGPIALIDETLPVVVLAPRGPYYEKVVSNLAEARARQGKVLAIATKGDAEIGGHADDVILVPDTALELQPILTVLPLQLLAYYVADFKGTDIDQPRNLAKSVTVE
ncbi:MAG: SIS domain-containing protein, partial [Microvirga sp.]